jgi:DNA-binding NtrC family response regulator
VKILIIDDEESIRYSLGLKLSKIEGVELLMAGTGEEGLEILKREAIKLAIIDIKLPGIDGIEVLKQINQIKIDTVVIMITYMSEVRLAVKAMKMGAYDYYTKPFSLSEIKKSVESVLAFIQKRSEIEIDKSGINGFIGSDESILQIKDTVKRIVNSGINTNILIQGESGSGKEVIAKYIYDSFGSNRPYVALNCAAVPKSLQESILFGYEKGAFTEAREQRIGLLEKANGGILFLDEIGDMDLDLQAKLLRVLENKQFKRVGGTDDIAFEAMVISATNKKIREEITYDHFRLDLYYRLNIIPINVIPLRQRRQDIPLLVSHFIGYYQQKMNTSIIGVTDEAMALLTSYEWLGNVRELKNTIERIMILSDRRYIDVDDLPKDVFFEVGSNTGMDGNLENAEREVIVQSLAKNQYNITKTANDLGISRTTLRNKMEKYRIDKP